MSDAIRLEYEVPGDDFTRAGEASSDVKRLLKKLGIEVTTEPIRENTPAAEL